MTTISLKPRDAFKVTGVSPELQRSWRAGGLLPKLEDGKRAEFGLADLVRLAAIKSAAQFHFAVAPITGPLENFLKWTVEEGRLDHQPGYLIVLYTLVLPSEPAAALIFDRDLGEWAQRTKPLMCCVLRISELAAEVRDAALALASAEKEAA